MIEIFHPGKASLHLICILAHDPERKLLLSVGGQGWVGMKSMSFLFTSIVTCRAASSQQKKIVTVLWMQLTAVILRAFLIHKPYGSSTASCFPLPSFHSTKINVSALFVLAWFYVCFLCCGDTRQKGGRKCQGFLKPRAERISSYRYM